MAVYDLVGEMTVERGSGPSVQVEVRPGGQDAGKLTVESTSIRGRPAIRVNFPEDHIVYPALGRHSNSNFSVNDDGTWGDSGKHSRRISVRGDGDGLEAHADITVRVPEGQRIAVFLGVGKIEASNVNGDISLDAASGDIRLTSVGGQLHVDTGSGNVEATTASGTLNIDTGSGDVRVTTFKGTVLDVETGSGNVQGSQIESPRLDIETGSGNITIAGAKSTDLESERRQRRRGGNPRNRCQFAGRGDRLRRCHPANSRSCRSRAEPRDRERRIPGGLSGPVDP